MSPFHLILDNHWHWTILFFRHAPNIQRDYFHLLRWNSTLVCIGDYQWGNFRLSCQWALDRSIKSSHPNLLHFPNLKVWKHPKIFILSKISSWVVAVEVSLCIILPNRRVLLVWTQWAENGNIRTRRRWCGMGCNTIWKLLQFFFCSLTHIFHMSDCRLTPSSFHYSDWFRSMFHYHDFTYTCLPLIFRCMYFIHATDMFFFSFFTYYMPCKHGSFVYKLVCRPSLFFS